jgi:prophage regulatory protein
MRDILERLRTDAGQLTIASLIQERGVAAAEISRLRETIERLTASKTVGGQRAARDELHSPSLVSRGAVKSSVRTPLGNAGSLLRLREVCTLLATSRSTIYKWVADGRFPRPVKISERSVRWKVADIESWRDTLD